MDLQEGRGKTKPEPSYGKFHASFFSRRDEVGPTQFPCHHSRYGSQTSVWKNGSFPSLPVLAPCVIQEMYIYVPQVRPSHPFLQSVSSVRYQTRNSLFKSLPPSS